MVAVNGKKLEVSGKTVSEVLELENYSPTRIAVELNYNILPKAKFNTTVLKDGDILEIVNFVGGGQ